MLEPYCRIPRCQVTCGRREWMCSRHWALVPHWLRQRIAESKSAARRGEPGALKHFEYKELAIRWVLVELWTLAFPVPPGHVDMPAARLRCTCPLCAQATALAAKAYAVRRYADSIQRAVG